MLATFIQYGMHWAVLGEEAEQTGWKEARSEEEKKSGPEEAESEKEEEDETPGPKPTVYATLNISSV